MNKEDRLALIKERHKVLLARKYGRTPAKPPCTACGLCGRINTARWMDWNKGLQTWQCTLWYKCQAARKTARIEIPI